MGPSFFFSSARFYFKNLFYASFTGYRFSRPYLSGLAFYNNKKAPIWYLMYGFFNGALLYRAALTLRQQVFLATSLELEKNDFLFARSGNYFFSGTADVREFTSRIISLRRRPYLTLYGQLKSSRGILVNLSSFYGAVVKHVSRTSNACLTVKTTSSVGQDYLLSNYLNVNQEAEARLLEFFDLLTLSCAANTQATQQFLLYLQKRTKLN